MTDTTQRTTITAADAQELMARWWYLYDEGRMDELGELFTDDVVFRCRTDSGVTDYEEFVRADVSGRDTVIAWNRRHREESPYPLRHYGMNFHVVERGADEASFVSYLYVTQVESVLPVGVSSAVVTGAVVAEGGQLRLSRMELILDMTTSVPFKEARGPLSAG